MLIILRKSALPWLVLVATLLFMGEARGQTRSYLEGTKTGNRLNVMNLGAGSAGLSSPMSSYINSGFKYYWGNENILTGSTLIPVHIKAVQEIGVEVLGIPLLGLGADTYIQFRNTLNAPIAAGKTTYFNIGQKPTLNGITVNVGGLLGIKELQSVQGFGYSGASAYVNSGNGNEGVGSRITPTTTKFLIDKDGKWYAAVTPTSAYNSVRLEVALPSDLRVADINLARSVEVDVYNAFTQGDGCGLSPQFTSPGEASGITLNTGIIGGLNLSALVKNPHLAINGAANDYSSFSSGLASVGVANSVSQNVYFDHSLTANDSIRVQLGIPKNLIELDVLTRPKIWFRAYSGTSTTPVYNEELASIASLLHLNLLNLVTINDGGNHKKLDLTFKPGATFDRFEIVFEKGLVAVELLGDALRIYEIGVAPLLPTIDIQPTDAAPTIICEDGNASFIVGATVPAGGIISAYQWQYKDASNNWVNQGAVGPAGATNTLNLTSVPSSWNNRWYRAKITGGDPLCPQEIYSNEVQLTVIPKALATHIDAPDVTICQGHSTTLTATCNNPAIINPTFKWYATNDVSGTPLATGSSYNVPTPTNTISYWVTIQGTATCQTVPSSGKEVKITVTPNPIAPAIIIN